MSLRSRLPRVGWEWLRRFGAAREGLAAIEFALILPVMVGLYIGAVEISEGVTVSRKVTHATSALGDLVAQSKTITDTDMENILDAASAVLAPYPVEPLSIVVSGVKIDANGVATITWSDARNGTALTVGATITVPAGLATPNTHLVTATVSYPYEPTIGYVITGDIGMEEEFFLRPRQGQVTRL